MEVTTSSTKETEKLAQQLAKKIKPGDALALYGELGSGKTTFTGFLVKALGFEDRVQSPTFIVMRHYKKGPKEIKDIYHVDLYRMTSKEELIDLGLQEFIEDKEDVVIIEWPELLESNLPKETIKIYFSYEDENVRNIKIQNIS